MKCPAVSKYHVYLPLIASLIVKKDSVICAMETSFTGKKRTDVEQLNFIIT